MALDPNIDEEDPYVAWARAQQNPLDTPYGAPPVQQIGPPLGAPTVDEQIAQQPPKLTPEEESQIEIDQAPGSQPPLSAPSVDAVSAAAPAATPSDVLAHEADVGYEPYAPPQPSPGADYAASYASPDARDAYVEHQQTQLGEQPLPSMRDKEAQKQADEEQRAVQAMTPEQYVQWKSDRDSVLMLRQAKAEREALQEDHRRAQEDQASDEAASAKTAEDTRLLIADAQRIANTKIDPDRYRKTRGLGQELGDIFAAFSLGLSGNTDAAMNVVDSKINRDIEAQTADLNNQYQGLGLRRSAIAEEYARHQDLHRAREAYRIAALQNASDQIKTDLQQYDQAGSIASRKRDQLAQLQAAQGQALQAFQQTQFKNHLEAIKTAVEVRKQQLEESKFLAAQQAKAAAGVKPADLLTPEEQAYIKQTTGIDFPVGTTRKDANARLETIRKGAETGKSGEELAKARRENTPEELTRQLSVGEITDEAGNPLKFRSVESAGKVAALKGSADFSVQLLDRLKAAHDKYGWTSDLIQSPEWQEMKADYGTLVVEGKNVAQLGALSGGDLDLIKNVLGATDPTGIRDPGPGLTRARENTIEKVNSTVRAEVPGQKIKRWAPPKPPPPAPTTPEQDQIKEMLGYSGGARVQGVKVSLKTLDDKFQKRIDRLVGVFYDPNATEEAQRQAGAYLQALQENAESSLVRDYATKAAHDASIQSIPTGEP